MKNTKEIKIGLEELQSVTGGTISDSHKASIRDAIAFYKSLHMSKETVLGLPNLNPEIAAYVDSVWDEIVI